MHYFSINIREVQKFKSFVKYFKYCSKSGPYMLQTTEKNLKSKFEQQTLAHATPIFDLIFPYKFLRNKNLPLLSEIKQLWP